MPDYADASYVEGWAMACSGLCIEHGWIVKGDKIVDPTLPDGPVVYFAGLEFKGRTEIEEFLKTPLGKPCKNSPFLYAFGWGGMQSPSFRESWRKCMDSFT